MFKEDEIYLFSSINHDRVLDRHDPTRIILDNDLLTDPIEPEELENSLVIFDDTDTIRDSKDEEIYGSFKGSHFRTR
jgi:hypothetical protein